jgi:hypothetical protein
MVGAVRKDFIDPNDVFGKWALTRRGHAGKSTDFYFTSHGWRSFGAWVNNTDIFKDAE